ncbi:MAG: hypothetical protein HXY41_10610 [Chloroflexi bacterium]|nr:hypothetical protein [Chloroflexota bacterium]
MSNQTHDPSFDDDLTIPARQFPAISEGLSDEPLPRPPDSSAQRQPSSSAPWLLKQFFANQINLAEELSRRYPSLPLLSVLRLRSLDTRHGLASLTTQDGVATLLLDADATGRLTFAFSYASALTLSFKLDSLSSKDRQNWLERMRREKDDVAFLWGESRWEKDYVICILHKRFINLYAFSQHNFEAAVRLTPEAANRLFDWLETLWQTEPADPEPPQILTW